MVYQKIDMKFLEYYAQESFGEIPRNYELDSDVALRINLHVNDMTPIPIENINKFVRKVQGEYAFNGPELLSVSSESKNLFVLSISFSMRD